ncbi:MAG: hypothetical protein PVJ67_06245 [Candidatus Pacearchaeota archaeon]|jgi:hypothetical protein
MESVEQLMVELSEAQRAKSSLAAKLRNLDYCIRVLSKEVAYRT